MTSGQGFLPMWASPPGETIRDVLHERSIGATEFAGMIDVTPAALDALLHGSAPISIDVARRLSKAVGGTPQFWVTRDCQYRDDLERVEVSRWMDQLPSDEMEGFGWIQPSLDWAGRASACLQFFGVEDVSSWKETYEGIQPTWFRTSASATASPGAVLAWLRQSEHQAIAQEVALWDPEAFRESLSEVRRLSRRRDPRIFLPLLTDLCAANGVALVVLRSPKNCPVSGVARFIASDKASIALSARYRSNDHLWFTFFHEAGHLLLHSPAEVYVDELGIDGEGSLSREEREANEFASEFLLPKDLYKDLPNRRLYSRDVVSLARKARIAPGVVVGQLQHAGILGHSNLNGLKRRYKWVGTNLEKA